jgi:hypothetical protein
MTRAAIYARMSTDKKNERPARPPHFEGSKSTRCRYLRSVRENGLSDRLALEAEFAPH